MSARADLSLSDARRIALAAQGLAGPRPAARSKSALLRTVDRLGVLQIDAVNVLARAHYVPLFSRHGPYDVAHLDAAAHGTSPSLFEYWGHQASFLPLSMHPLMRWRMADAADLKGIYGGLRKFARSRRRYLADVLAEVRDRGPVRASELTQSRPRSGGWWGWSDAKRALELLFWSGQVTTATRKNFERVYDLPERVIPPAILALPSPSAEDAQRELVRHSSRALGIATEDDLADYFRLRLREVRPRVAELVEDGSLTKVRVATVAKPFYLASSSKTPRVASASALLSPFDPLIWYRARTERLFGFHYRIEIYTPEHLRQHGYYVLPFLHGEALAARVDLKADRAAGTLLVQSAHLEPPADGAATAEALAVTLRELAEWLALERVRISRRGTLTLALAAHFR